MQDEHRRDRSSGATRIVPSLAVLPFTNLSPEPENEYIADGITEEIINTLAQIKGLQVAARTSSFSFKGKTPDLADVAAKLHVAHVVTGSVRKAGPRLRITVQLVNAHDGFPIWSERYDREAVDIFEIQDEIAAAIAQKLRIALTTPDEPMAKRPTDNLDAYELYLKGRFLVNQRGAALFKGLGPGLWNSLRFAGRALHALGRADEAIDCFQRAAAVSDRHPWPLLDLADVLAQAGRASDAAVWVDEICERAASQYVSPLAVAAALASVDRRGEATAWLERAYRERDTSIPPFATWPFGMGFAEHPTLDDILRRIGLSRGSRSR